MRKQKSLYWVGVVPSRVKAWQGASHAVQMTDNATLEAVFRLYRRYAKYYNDIELDRFGDLSKQQPYCNATVLTVNQMFVVTSSDENRFHWTLQLTFRRGFSSFHLGSTLNTLRSVSDIKGFYLHYNLDGADLFEKWLLKEKKENEGKGEWTKYNGVDFI